MRRALLLVGLVAACGRATPDLTLDADSVAAAIDAEVATRLGDTVAVHGLSTEGGFLEAHYAGDAIRRLRGALLGELGRTTETFYYNPHLFLVIRSEERYDAPLSGRVTDSTVARIYLDPDRVARWYALGSTAPVLDSLAAARARDSLVAAAEALRARIPRSGPPAP